MSAGMILAAGRHPDELPAFRVGVSRYLAKLTPGPLLFEGVPVRGATMADRHEILIAGDAPPGGYLFVLLRELCRAWGFETGTPAPGDVAGWCNLAATAMVSMLEDLRDAAGAVPAEPKPVRRPFACPLCGRRLTTSARVRRHLQCGRHAGTAEAERLASLPWQELHQLALEGGAT